MLEALGSPAAAIALERPGWDGDSAATDLPGNASAALAVLDAAGIERATVVGHSFGGAVAAWLAVHHPDRVSALVLAAPAANRRSLSFVDRVLAVPVVGAAFLAGAAGALSLRRVRQALAARLELDERYLRGLARVLARPASWRAFVVEQRALLRGIPLLEPELGRIGAPTVIVAGVADRIVPAAASRALADQINGAELVMLPRAGHLLPHRHAARLAEVIGSAGHVVHDAA